MERLSQKKPLKRVARAIFVSQDTLEAIEAWDTARLPERAYLRGILNSYAALFGVTGLPAEHTITPKRLEVAPGATPRTFVLSRYLIGAGIAVVAVTLVFYLGLLVHELVARPMLQVIEPAEVVSTTDDVVSVRGRTESETLVRINGQSTPVSEKGEFTSEVIIRQGQNDIEVVGINSLGRESMLVRQVNRQP